MGCPYRTTALVSVNRWRSEIESWGSVSAPEQVHNHLWSWRIRLATPATCPSRDERPTRTGVVHLIYCSWFNLIKPSVWLSRSQVRGIIHRGAACYESQYHVICNRLWLLASLHKHQGAFTFHGLVITVRWRRGALLKRRTSNLIQSGRQVWFRHAATGFGAFSYNYLSYERRTCWICHEVARLLFNPKSSDVTVFVSIWLGLKTLKVRIFGLVDSTEFNF